MTRMSLQKPPKFVKHDSYVIAIYQAGLILRIPSNMYLIQRIIASSFSSVLLRTAVRDSMSVMWNLMDGMPASHA